MLYRQAINNACDGFGSTGKADLTDYVWNVSWLAGKKNGCRAWKHSADVQLAIFQKFLGLYDPQKSPLLLK